MCAQSSDDGDDIHQGSGPKGFSGFSIYDWIIRAAVVAVLLQLLIYDLQRRIDSSLVDHLKQEYCEQGLFTSEEYFKKSGFILLKGFVSEEGLEDFLADADTIDESVRYVCGASELQPDECVLDEEALWNRFHFVMSNVSELFQGWKASGITTKLKLDRWGDVRVMGSEYISINAWPYPWSMLKGSWEYVMGGPYFPDVISSLKGHLTMAANIPFYSGYHGWHVDGDGAGGSRFHKLFIMIWKDGHGSDPRDHSNLVLVPNHFWNEVENLRVERAKAFPIFTAIFGSAKVLFRESDSSEMLGCTVRMDPGDALFFRENVAHRTQNMDSSRLSIIMDVQ